MTDTASAPRRWLHGPASDLLLGCGGLFAAVFVFFAAAGPEVFARVPIAVPALLTYLVSMPHYGATLVRVYDHRHERRAYALFSIWATLVLFGLFLAGLASPVLASVLLTVYLTWSPWHYAAQSYGVSVMFLRRRQVPLSPVMRRFLHGSFVLSFLIVATLLHTEDPSRGVSTRSVRVVPIGIPADWALSVFGVLSALYAACTLAFLASALRVARPRALAPALVLLLTQLLWFALPYGLSGLRFDSTWVPLDRDQRSSFFVWVGAAHAIQYLWVTSFYARSAADWNGTTRYYAKVLAAGTAIWILPGALLAPTRLGLPELSGFVLLVAAIVNLHHFVLDGAIWKLRRPAIAGVLIESDAAAAPDSARAGARRLVWALAGVGALMAGGGFWVETFTLPAAIRSERPRDVVQALDLLWWLQHDSAPKRLWAARRLERDGDVERAMTQYRRSLELDPSIPVLTDLIRIHYRSGDAPAALEDACRGFYRLLPGGERELAAVDAAGLLLSEPAPAQECYRQASEWRLQRAAQQASEGLDGDASTGRADRSLAFGY